MRLTVFSLALLAACSPDAQPAANVASADGALAANAAAPAAPPPVEAAAVAAPSPAASPTMVAKLPVETGWYLEGEGGRCNKADDPDDPESSGYYWVDGRSLTTWDGGPTFASITQTVPGHFRVKADYELEGVHTYADEDVEVMSPTRFAVTTHESNDGVGHAIKKDETFVYVHCAAGTAPPPRKPA